MVFLSSSRRRHTRYWRDWSSDVCSSDLNGPIEPAQLVDAGKRGVAQAFFLPGRAATALRVPGAGAWESNFPIQIGRAACRERVSISVDAASLKKKKIVEGE